MPTLTCAAGIAMQGWLATFLLPVFGCALIRQARRCSGYLLSTHWPIMPFNLAPRSRLLSSRPYQTVGWMTPRSFV
ncbi:hypothetical protein BO71DRAFT_395343 [Aspergillus ellipticus CBS 707.79]|uniref:Uncharacterized protein n=1 Tax=Aspergillus ellipticus CBS 707.79 TaxID=1448320 RepID=A0A319DLI2_9EURO|nr:hypothetical protein BO71DRAFT_395343 [Aspergillus ellipticus CBS 707.79]